MLVEKSRNDFDNNDGHDRITVRNFDHFERDFNQRSTSSRVRNAGHGSSSAHHRRSAPVPVRHGQLFVLAGRLAVAQLQAFKVHVLPVGQAHVAAAGASAAAAARDDRVERQAIILEIHQNPGGLAVDQRAVAAAAIVLAVLLDTVRVEMRENTAGSVQARVAVLLGQNTSQ